MKINFRFTVIALFVALIGLVACNKDKTTPGYEYMPNMYRSPSFKTYEANPNVSNGAMALPVVDGTVPRGYFTYMNPNTPEGYQNSLTQTEYPSKFSNISEEDFAEGKRQYEIYCSVCHGDKGEGNGVLVKNEKIVGVPSYSSASRPGLTPVSIYHVITYGKGIMGAHAAQVLPTDRWKVVHYVESLRSELDGKTQEN
jgi:mono/diheme cytochrome c family protein